MTNIGRLLLVLVIATFSFGCAIRAYKVPTGAMAPTINPGDGAIGDEISYKLGSEIKRFDIVVFKAPKDERLGSTDEQEVRFIFRVIGLGGERVEIKNGVVLINEKTLEESFQRNEGGKDFPPIVIPENEYFLLGDNRPESWDSRFWKPSTIKRADIYGKVIEIMPGYFKED